MLYSNKRNDAKTTFHHIQNNTQNGGASIGWREFGDKVVYALSVCSKTDAFSKKTARDFINTRLDSVSETEDGAIQIPKGLSHIIDVIDLSDIHYYLSEFGEFPNMTNTKKLQTIHSMKLRDCSYATLKEVYYYKMFS